MVGVWPAAPWQERVPFYELTLVLTLIALLGLRMLLATPWGLALRAARDAPARAAALGVNVARTQVQALGSARAPKTTWVLGKNRMASKFMRSGAGAWGL